jgi:hypothetical protein
LLFFDVEPKRQVCPGQLPQPGKAIRKQGPEGKRDKKKTLIGDGTQLISPYTLMYNVNAFCVARDTC